MKLRERPTFVRTSRVRLSDRDVDLGRPDDRPENFGRKSEAVQKAFEVVVETFKLEDPGKNAFPSEG